MLTWVALAAALASAVAYGVGTAGQHASAFCGEVSGRGLAELLRDRRWLLSSIGDLAGVLLQLVALGYGPVVLVQPVLVLSLPVAVLVGSWFGLPRPRRVDLVRCGLLVAGLGLFFACLGHPARGAIISSATAGLTAAVALAVGASAILLTRHRSAVPRAVVFGAVAGSWFGVVSVLMEAVSEVWRVYGVTGFTRPHGLAPLLGVIVLAVGGYLMVQIGFQLGPLGASFPANLILDPVVAVIMGAVLLHERVPLGGLRLPGYLLAVAIVGWAAVRVACDRAPELSGSRASSPAI